jgi:uncharacterized protein YlaI
MTFLGQGLKCLLCQGKGYLDEQETLETKSVSNRK